jgi:hypothetical protein
LIECLVIPNEQIVRIQHMPQLQSARELTHSVDLLRRLLEGRRAVDEFGRAVVKFTLGVQSEPEVGIHVGRHIQLGQVDLG